MQTKNQRFEVVKVEKNDYRIIDTHVKIGKSAGEEITCYSDENTAKTDCKNANIAESEGRTDFWD
jgi:hypothetical protein